MKILFQIYLYTSYVNYFTAKKGINLPPPRAAGPGKGVGLSLKPGRSAKTDRRKNSIGHTIFVPSIR